jgi:hypothetical protein
MRGPGWLLRFTIAVLFVVIVLVAIGLGWVKPGLFFYVATSVVGLLVWLDYERNRRSTCPEDERDPTKAPSPDSHKDGGPTP